MILLIDDSDNERAVIRKMLESGGHEVHEANGGDAGVALFAQARPHLVICDLMMPHKDGFDTVADMRKLAPKAKIIAMSGVWYGKADHAAMAKNLGLVAVIEKPFDRPQLLELVARTLMPKPKKKAKPKARKKAAPKPKKKPAKKKPAKKKAKAKRRR